MKQAATIALLSAGLLFHSGPADADKLATIGEIDLGLQDVLDVTAPNEVVSTLIFLWDQGDMPGLKAALDNDGAGFAERNRETIRTLMDTAALTQGELLGEIERLHARGAVEYYRSFWITNAIQVDATPDVIHQLAQHPDVKRIYYNIGIESIEPIAAGADGDGGGAASSTPEIGLEAIRAPEAWALGYTGQGRLVSSLDTGVDGNHPALASRWIGNDPAYANNPEWAWFDPVTETTFPQEFSSSSHGTHTMGTIAGGAPGDTIGVAPGSRWLHAAVIDRVNINQTVADAIASFEWIVNPTGDPDSTFGVPDVNSNSWGVTSGMGFPACDDLFWSFIDNAEAAGVVMIFAAGNEGNNGLRRPADRATTDHRNVAVAAVDANNPNWPIASFSSLGPTNCTPDGSSAEKPDISAPGVSVRSAVNGGGYGQLSGTSMAAPHIAGVAALLREACPDLTPEQLMQIIYDTAVDLGTAGKNSTYGYGMVDAYEAVLLAEANCGFSLSVIGGVPSLVAPGQSFSFDVRIVENDEDLVPGSALLYYRFDPSDSFQSVPLTPVGGEMYEATVPAAGCDDTPQFYVTAEGDGGTVQTVPGNAPASLFSTAVGELVTAEMYAADFAGGLPSGWSAGGLWNVTSACAVAGDCQGPQYAYFGSPSSCGTGTNSGTMTSAPITLPQVGPNGSITLSFCYNLQTGFLLSEGTFSIGSISQNLPDASQWTTRTVDVTSLAGQTVDMSWSFSNGWPFSNPRGLQVDTITIDITTIECEFAPDCPADLNNDGVVNGGDLLIMLGEWGTCPGCDGDLNDDGVVNGEDLLILLGAWGVCP